LEIDNKIRDMKYNIELLSTISAIIDSFGYSVLQNTPQIIAFMKSMLEWSETCTGLVESGDILQNSSVDLVLMLLSTLLGSGQVSIYNTFSIHFFYHIFFIVFVLKKYLSYCTLKFSDN